MKKYFDKAVEWDKKLNTDEILVREKTSLVLEEEKNPLLNNKFILQKNKFLKNEDENIDVVYSLNDIENPIYFTFHQCIGKLYGTGINKYLLIHSLLNALTIVEEYYKQLEECYSEN